MIEEDMDNTILDLAQNFLDNGGELPDSSTAKKRFEFQAGINKLLYGELRAMRSDMKAFTESLSEIRKSPSMLWLFRYRTAKFIGIVGGALGGLSLFMLALWLALYAVVQMPGVREWLHAIIGFPMPPT